MARRNWNWTSKQFGKLNKVKAILQELEDYKPLTLRQVYYQMVGEGFNFMMIGWIFLVGLMTPETKEHISERTILRHLNNRKSFIYFIQAENGLIKIGTCIDLSLRLSALQTGSPLKLSVIGTYQSTTLTEKELHKKYDYCKSHGEWFYPDIKLLNFIKEINNE